MRILLTNDDGIDSPGLAALREVLEPDHDVWILAPDSERSAMSHYITIRDPIRCQRVEEKVYASSGSPADCVIVGMLGALPEKPDMVVSGINIGPNLGTDIIYSGTVAAARQAAFMGVPGIAVSINTYTPPYHLGPLADFLARNLEVLQSLWNRRHLININGPNVDSNDLEVEVTRPRWRIYHDQVEEFRSPRGDLYYFLTGHPVDSQMEEGSDWTAVAQGRISISPVYLNPIDHHEDEAYRNALFERSGV